jgi:hypothetical protein
MPTKKLRILFLIKAMVVPPTFLALFLWAVIVTYGGGPLVTSRAEVTLLYMNKAYSTLTDLNVIIGLFSSIPSAGRQGCRMCQLALSIMTGGQKLSTNSRFGPI